MTTANPVTVTTSALDFGPAKTAIAFAERCGKHGVELEHFQLGIDDPARAERIAGYLKAGAPLTWPLDLTIEHYGETPAKRALEIMKISYGIEVLERHFPWKFTKYQRSLLETVPFSESFLESIAHVYGMLPKHPLASLMGIKKETKNKAGLWYPEDWFHNAEQEFAYAGSGNGWLFVRKDEVPDSWEKDYPTSLGCLAPIEIPPLCCEATLFAVLHRLEKDESLFSKRWIRFRDRSANGDRVRARFSSVGWFVCNWRGGDATPDVGLASALRTS